MTAPPSMASTTTQMLAEIGVGTAAELLLGVRYNTSPPGPTFIPDLDAALFDARPHVGGSSLRRGDLLELVGPSGSGKTTMCTFLLATTLLPSLLSVPGTSTPIPLGGRGMRAALVYPRTPRCVLPLLVRGMRAHIASCLPPQYDPRAPIVQDLIDSTIKAALSNLIVLRTAARAAGWSAALRRVLELESPDVVVCDGFADGFWPERWADEERGKRVPLGSEVRAPDNAGFRDVWDAVTALRRERGTVVVLTVQGLRPIPNTPFFKPHLPPPYPSPFRGASGLESSPGGLGGWGLTIQLTLLGRSRALQMPAETMLADALRARTSPAMQVFGAILRMPGGRGAAGTTGGVRWSFGVGRDGLVPFSHE